MGYMVHHAIIVTGWPQDHGMASTLRDVHAEAVRLGMTVTDIVASPVNSYESFLVAPDGSKAGWMHSAEGDAQRAALIAYMDAHPRGCPDWVEVQYGDERGDVRVLRDGQHRTPHVAPVVPGERMIARIPPADTEAYEQQVARAHRDKEE